MFRTYLRVTQSLIAWGAACAVTVGCHSGSNQNAGGPKPVVIFAAASTKEPVEAIAEQFRRDTGTPVIVTLGGSSQLAKQIDQGAPADLFLSADEASVDFLAVRQKVQTRRNLLTNRLVIVALADSKLDLKTLADLADARFAKIAVAEKKVPAGAYARQALTKVGVLEQVRARFVGGVDVRATLQFVVRGECEAGIVYATDVAAREGGVAAGVRVLLEVPEDLHNRIVYPLAILNRDPAEGSRADDNRADQADVAKFYDYLRSDRARDVFRDAKFGIAPGEIGAAGGAGGERRNGSREDRGGAAGDSRRYIAAGGAAGDSRRYILAWGGTP